MNVRLTPHGEQLLKHQLALGGFHSAEEVIEHALEMLAGRELAIRRNLSIATTDEALRRAAERAGVPVEDVVDGL